MVDQGLNYIFFIIKYGKFSQIVFELLSLLATMHFFVIINIHAYSIAPFLFLCAPQSNIFKGWAV